MAHSSRILVFIVDDNPELRQSLKTYLEMNNIEAESYPSIEEFLCGYRPHDRACLLLDQRLQHTTGLEFIKSTECRSLNIPIILMTGTGARALQHEALVAGATAYLEKPFGGRIFLANIYSATSTRPRICS
jgi:FixJ family two-component response regulator